MGRLSTSRNSMFVAKWYRALWDTFLSWSLFEDYYSKLLQIPSPIELEITWGDGLFKWNAYCFERSRYGKKKVLCRKSGLLLLWPLFKTKRKLVNSHYPISLYKRQHFSSEGVSFDTNTEWVGTLYWMLTSDTGVSQKSLGTRFILI